MGIFTVVGIICYLAAAWVGMASFYKTEPADHTRRKVVMLGLAGATAHAGLLYQNIVRHGTLDMGLFNALSSVTWATILITLLLCVVSRFEKMIIVFSPMAIIAILLQQFYPEQGSHLGRLDWRMIWHMALSITAYSLFMIATLQALAASVQSTLLRRKYPHRLLSVLPPLEEMERWMIEIVAAGFFLLSLSLATGFVFLYDVKQQHLSHKIFFAVLAWVIYAVLLVGHWRFGWRGQRLLYWLVAGFVGVLLSYFGSKFVLEVILRKAW